MFFDLIQVDPGKNWNIYVKKRKIDKNLKLI